MLFGVFDAKLGLIRSEVVEKYNCCTMAYRLSGSLSDKLISAIITAASIPGESPDSVISGEGEVSIQAEKLMLDFEWTAAVPYDYPHDSGHGMVELSMG